VAGSSRKRYQIVKHLLFADLIASSCPADARATSHLKSSSRGIRLLHNAVSDIASARSEISPDIGAIDDRLFLDTGYVMSIRIFILDWHLGLL
jgi:hypothetical protein